MNSRRFRRVKKGKDSYTRNVKGKEQTVRDHEQNYHILRNPHTVHSSKDKLEEWIGERALKESNWLSLDPDYPNLKGVHPERVEWLINQFPKSRSPEGEERWELLKKHTETGQIIAKEEDDLANLLSKGLTQSDIKDVIENRIKFYDRDEIFKACYEIHQQHLRDRQKEEKDDIDFINKKFDEIEKDINSDKLYEKIKTFFDSIWAVDVKDEYNKKLEINYLLGMSIGDYIVSGANAENINYMLTKYPGRNQEQALSTLKNMIESGDYDRDSTIKEMGEKYLSSNGGKELSETDYFVILNNLVEELSLIKRLKDSRSDSAEYDAEKFMGYLGLADMEPTYEINKFINEKIEKKRMTLTKIDLKNIDIDTLRERAIRKVEGKNEVRDDKTIYVTSPRGGHELLSIYAYANNLKKENIPSDIIHKGETNELNRFDYTAFESSSKGAKLKYDIKTGMTFLGDTTSENIQRVVVVDDIVGSGQQKAQFYKVLRHKFPEAQLYYITIASRKEEYQHFKFDYEIKSYKEKYKTLFADRGFIKSRYKNETVGLMGYANGDEGMVSVVFPWAVPDGRSDAISRLLLQPEDRSMRNIGLRRR